MSYVIGKDASQEDEVIKDLVLEEAARDDGSACLSPTAQMQEHSPGPPTVCTALPVRLLK